MHIHCSFLNTIDKIFKRKVRLVSIFQNTLLLIVAFTVWFIGSLVVIQIDLGKKLEIFEVSLENQLESQIKLIDSCCQELERKAMYKPKIETEAETEINTLRRAKMEKIVRDNLIFIPKLNQMWCLVPKAASTTWSAVLVDHLNLNKNDGIQNGVRNCTPNQVILKQKFGYSNKITFEDAVRDESVKKVLLARHPFARIASAFENKLKNRTATFDSQHFFQNYGALIYRKYRKDRRVKRREPTFLEFIEYLIDTDPIHLDEHWQPISLLCGLCNIRYDVIIRTEDLETTAKFHLKKLGIKTSTTYKPLRQENMRTGENKIHNYYDNISTSKMVLLYKKYEMDFHLFNYSFQEYFTP